MRFSDGNLNKKGKTPVDFVLQSKLRNKQGENRGIQEEERGRRKK